MKLKIIIIFLLAQADGYFTFKGLINNVYKDEANIILKILFNSMGLYEGIIFRALLLFVIFIFLMLAVSKYDVDTKLIRFSLNVVLLAYVLINVVHYLYLS